MRLATEFELLLSSKLESNIGLIVCVQASKQLFITVSCFRLRRSFPNFARAVGSFMEFTHDGDEVVCMSVLFV